MFKIVIFGGNAFAEISENYLLLICTEEEIRQSTQTDIEEMVEDALMVKKMEDT